MVVRPQANLKIEDVSAPKSFVFLWVGAAEGLQQVREDPPLRCSFVAPGLTEMMETLGPHGGRAFRHRAAAA